jgi:hypothetical protein
MEVLALFIFTEMPPISWKANFLFRIFVRVESWFFALILPVAVAVMEILFRLVGLSEKTLNF